MKFPQHGHHKAFLLSLAFILAASRKDDGTVDLRAERTGTPKVPGNGRVYHVSFMATDSMSETCAGVVTVCVPHDMGQRKVCVDGGPLYNSTE